DGAQSRDAHRSANRGGHSRTRAGTGPQPGATPNAGSVATFCDPRTRSASRTISPSALRRLAATRHDRDGPGWRTAAPDRGRANDSARRYSAEADRGVAGSTTARITAWAFVYHP